MLRDYNYDADGYTLSSSAKAKIKQVIGLGENKPKGWSLTKWYELLASLLYINKVFKMPSQKLVFDKLKTLKAKFNNCDSILVPCTSYSFG